MHGFVMIGQVRSIITVDHQVRNRNCLINAATTAAALARPVDTLWKYTTVNRYTQGALCNIHLLINKH